MQNVQNNFTVENIVAKYRNYVKEHCSMICTLVEGSNGVEELDAPDSPSGDADVQLLIYLYSIKAGEKADKSIVDALSKYKDVFYKNALNDEEINYLCNHFTEYVSYEFAQRNKWGGYNHVRSDRSIPEDRLTFVRNNIKPEYGATVFVADSGYCDLAVGFNNCIVQGFTGTKFYREEVWALGQIRMYAAGVKSEVVAGKTVDGKYLYKLPDKGTVDYVILGVQEDYSSECNDIEALYELLKPGGKMLYCSEFIEEMVGNTGGLVNFRKRLVEEKTISTIISYKDKNYGFMVMDNMVLVINKKPQEEVKLIDTAKNNSITISSSELDAEILWPNYYFSKHPSKGLSLSDLVSFQKCDNISKVHEGGEWSFPEGVKKMPVVHATNMAQDYKDSNLLSKQLDCAEKLNEVDSFQLQLIKEPCLLLYGREGTMALGYLTEIPESGMATLRNVVCLVPNKGVDIRYVAALLLSSCISEQIKSVCDGLVNNYIFPLVMDKIIVPNHSDMERLSFLSDANYAALLSTQNEMMQEHKNYTKAVRNRKHALSQSLSSIEALFDPLNQYRIRKGGVLKDDDVISSKGTTVRYVFDYLSKHIEELMPVLDHIADVEYTFAKPIQIDPEEFIENYIKKEESGWLNFKAVMTWDKNHNKNRYDLDKNGHIIPDGEIDKRRDEIVFHKGNPISTIFFPKDALERIFDNILSNAKSHAFTDNTRKDYLIRFSWEINGTSLTIKIENNGSPLPEDRDTSSLLEYGVSSCLHQNGHNGIGCNEIDDIMSRYNGSVHIISTPDEEYTVKYILTFNYTNTINERLEYGY